jgi:hypothetical protein
MIVVFAMLLSGLLALGGLVLDMGLVILTQGQMQVGVDPAALEGLRVRDAVDVNGEPLGDENRRHVARMVTSLVYDDDLDPAAAPTQPLQLGAGPELELSDGITDFNASRLVSLPTQRTYVPALELNVENLAHGDMVAGTFTPPEPALPGHEDAGYARNDFVPSDHAGSPTANAFLVRLRRTNDFAGLDQQAGVSSSGTAIPLLVGNGSVVTTGGDNYSVRHHGFTVRATAIADARPALRVGLPQTTTTPPLEGATPFALDQEFWATLEVNHPVVVSVDAAGTIFGGAMEAGRFTPPPPIPPAPPDPTVVTAVGQVVVPAAPVLEADITGYVPIYLTIIEGALPVERVIGFGHIAVVGVPPTIQLTKLPTFVAPGNASRHLGQVAPLPDAAIWPVLFAEHAAMAKVPGTVLAPALVR